MDRGAEAHEKWQQQFDAWAAREPERKELLDRLLGRDLPDGWDDDAAVLGARPEGRGHPQGVRRGAQRRSARRAARAVGRLGGPRREQQHHDEGRELVRPDVDRHRRCGTPSPYGRTLHFGVREHAMGAILHGIALHGPTRPYGGTFLQFTDYMRGAVRLAALMKAPAIYVWTHDSIGLGEDGPTHQPIEHLAALRAIPNLSMVRPGDANETAYAWKAILENAGAARSGIALTRQSIPVLEGTSAEGVARGGYVLADASNGDAAA